VSKVVMCEIKSKEKKQPKTNPPKKVQWLVVKINGPHLTSNEKMQPIQCTEQPIGALVAISSFWLIEGSF